jgi:hypothetical protein
LSSTHSDLFDYIEMFYNTKRRHGFNTPLSSVEFEKDYVMSLQASQDLVRSQSPSSNDNPAKIGVVHRAASLLNRPSRCRQRSIL